MKRRDTKWIGLGLMVLSAVLGYSQTNVPAGGGRSGATYEQKLHPLETKPMPILSSEIPMIPPASGSSAATPVTVASAAAAAGPNAVSATTPEPSPKASAKPAKRFLVVVEQAPPPARPELVPLAPGANYVWIPGYWSWREGEWLWHGGQWVMRPAPGLRWLDGHWARHGRGWTWISGQWR